MEVKCVLSYSLLWAITRCSAVSGPHFENLYFKATNGPITNSLLSNASYLLLQDCEIMAESVTRPHFSMWHKTQATSTLAATWWPENIKYIRLADHQLLYPSLIFRQDTEPWVYPTSFIRVCVKAGKVPIKEWDLFSVKFIYTAPNHNSSRPKARYIVR